METIWIWLAILGIALGNLIAAILINRRIKENKAEAISFIRVEKDKQYIWFLGEDITGEELEQLNAGFIEHFGNDSNFLLVATEPPKTILEF